MVPGGILYAGIGQLLFSLERRIASTDDTLAARHASGIILGWRAACIDDDLGDFE
jgi:hypothetical protein